MRHVREVTAYNLPLRALFDKDQGGSAIGGYRLAVLGGTPKHVVSIHYPHNIVVNAAGWLPKAELVEAIPSKASLRNLAKRGLPSNR
jgi:hypothetical protein